MRLIQILSGFLILSSTVNALLCSNYAIKCQSELGKPLHNANQATTIKMSKGESFYFTFTMPNNVAEIDLDLSIYYGSVDIYVAKNKEPSPNSYEISNTVSGEKDYLQLVGNLFC
jgi:hypothetical protein